jgi:hypothetical protein
LVLAILTGAGTATPDFSHWCGTAGVPAAGGKSTPAPVRLKKRCAKRLCSSAAIGTAFFLCLVLFGTKTGAILVSKASAEPRRHTKSGVNNGKDTPMAY